MPRSALPRVRRKIERVDGQNFILSENYFASGDCWTFRFFYIIKYSICLYYLNFCASNVFLIKILEYLLVIITNINCKSGASIRFTVTQALIYIFHTSGDAVSISRSFPAYIYIRRNIKRAHIMHDARVRQAQRSSTCTHIYNNNIYIHVRIHREWVFLYIYKATRCRSIRVTWAARAGSINMNIYIRVVFVYNINMNSSFRFFVRLL